MPTKLTTEIITAAIEGLESQKSRIDEHIAELRAVSSNRIGRAAAPNRWPGTSRKVSAAARKRMSQAQRQRWAAIKKESESPAQGAATKPKRKLSAAGRKRIIEATKKRWAAVRAAKGQH